MYYYYLIYIKLKYCDEKISADMLHFSFLLLMTFCGLAELFTFLYFFFGWGGEGGGGVRVCVALTRQAVSNRHGPGAVQ